MRTRMKGGVCGPGCWPLSNGGCDCDSVTALARRQAQQRLWSQQQMRGLGFITNEITMSLGDGNVNLGYITPKITTMLGEDVPSSGPSAGTIGFWILTLGIGIAAGAAFGIQHGVKISRG